MAPNPKLGDMMDEVDFELCLDIDQYAIASRCESKRLSTQSATDSTKHENVQTATFANPKVRKHGELDSASGIDENITPEQPHHPRPCKKLKTLNHSESDLEDDHDRTYLDIAIKRITHHDQEILSDADDTDPETHSSTSASTTAINEEEMDLDTDTDAEVHANSRSDDIGISPVYSYIARPSHFFEIYEDLDDSHLENHPGFMSSFTTYSSHDEDKENIRDNHHEQTQEMGVSSQMWIRQSSNRVSHMNSGSNNTMHWEYTTLYSRIPRSFIFAVVANVGPGGASRSLAVAYRQHHDEHNMASSWPRVHHMVTDTLALIDVLSDPANRAPLEAERALAQDWYRRSPGHHEPPLHERPSVPDTAQPPFVPWNRRREPVQQQPPLPWRDDGLSQFPFTATCVLLALLRDDRPADATRPSDVQFQPLSTVFRADCTEYGLVVVDISNLDSGVKYGIVAFPLDYMAEVQSRDKCFGWDPVEDPQPEKEPDVILVSPRPRVLLSISQWAGKYYRWSGLEDHPSILRLEEKPLADAAALDYFTPSNRARSTPRSMVGYTIVDEPPRHGSMDRAKEDRSTRRASSVTILEGPPQTVPVDIDRTIDDLLLLTQEPVSPRLEKQALAHLQMLVPFSERLRQRLEEVPNKLGPSTISSHVLRVAYTERSHLNWVSFGNLPPRVIAAAVTSDELRGASALSLCVDAWAGDEEEGESDLVDPAVALAQSTGLQQLCFLHQPDRAHDEVSARFCSQLLRLWGRASEEDWEWLRPKTIHSTSVFLTGLRRRRFLTSSSTIRSDSSFTLGAQVFPMIHLFTFLGPLRKDIPDATADRHVYCARPGYSSYYSIDNIGLTAEVFAIRFLGYLRALGPYSDPDKAILRVAYHGAFSSLASMDDDSEQHRRKHGWSPPRRPLPPSPLRSSPDPLGVRPIPAGFFDDELAPDDPSKVRLGDIPPGDWVVLVDRRDRSCRASDDTTFLQYSFMRIRQPCVKFSSEKQSSSVEMVGGLTDFLRETVPGTNIAMWERRVDEVENDLVSALMRPSPSSTPSSVDVPTMLERVNKSFRRLAEASAETSASSTLRESDISDGEELVVEVEKEPCIDVGVMAESRAYTLLDKLV